MVIFVQAVGYIYITIYSHDLKTGIFMSCEYIISVHKRDRAFKVVTILIGRGVPKLIIASPFVN